MPGVNILPQKICSAYTNTFIPTYKISILKKWFLGNVSTQNKIFWILSKSFDP
jgi:hypothetical protein